jgi:diguanylate cyclase (GGDEF)-like protein
MVGTLAGDVFMADRSRETVEQFFLAANHGFGIDQATALELLEGIGQGTREMGKLFEINAHTENETQTILADANEVLLQLSLRTQQNASQLEAQNRELKQKAERDALTGIANRGRFNDYLCQQFEHATRQPQPLSMILIDADRFKSVNDQHGHIVGDEVLTAIARTLAETAPENALVARYGGEEFALVLPNLDRKNAAQLAEQLRLAVQAVRIELDSGQTLAVTISLGVATYDGVRFYTAPQQLIKAADQAVYAAKAAGRNCVRVFAPRTPAPAPSR